MTISSVVFQFYWFIMWLSCFVYIVTTPFTFDWFSYCFSWRLAQLFFSLYWFIMWLSCFVYIVTTPFTFDWFSYCFSWRLVHWVTSWLSTAAMGLLSYWSWTYLPQMALFMSLTTFYKLHWALDIWYRWFHEKGTFSVHSFNDDYLSIPERAGSYKYLFHEIPVTKNLFVNMLFKPSFQIEDFKTSITSLLSFSSKDQS